MNLLGSLNLILFYFLGFIIKTVISV